MRSKETQNIAKVKKFKSENKFYSDVSEKKLAHDFIQNSVDTFLKNGGSIIKISKQV